MRCYLRAKDIRQQSLNYEHIDCATVYNNLGCCLFMLGRNLESLTYFKTAHSIFALELGEFHVRTQTCARNIMKSNKS